MEDKQQQGFFVKEVPGSIQEDRGGSGSAWQLTYLDTITLLLAFIIIMAGIAGVNLFIFEEPGEGVYPDQEGVTVIETPILELEEDLRALLDDKLREGALIIETDPQELRMHFRGSSFYNVGEATLLQSGQNIIDRILQVIMVLDHYQFNVDIEGHADSTPIRTLRFPSNWELSVARASNVVRYFVEMGFDVERLKASGYGDTFPVAPNKDADGNPIPENQDMNRRIVIRLYY